MKKKTIHELNKEHQERTGKILDDLGIFWAFSNEQFKEKAQEGVVYVSGGWFSFYSRVLNSIQDYEYGNKPFKAYQKTIRELKVGELFKLKDTDTSPVWQRGEYVREENLKKFCCTKYNDINHSKNFDGKQVVYVDFTF